MTLAAAATLSLAAGSTAAAAPNAPLGHSGRWITDAAGRVVILHGVNMVYKQPPYYPAAAGFDDPDAAFLEQNGFNTVRLGLIYKGVEPNAGTYDEAYLDQIAATEANLAQHNVFSLLDFHQDLYNERFQGEGWPDWATIDDGVPAQPLTGFPGSYITSPGLNQAFDNFWANRMDPGGVGLQDRYAAAFRRVAQRIGASQHTIGFDLLNEPWPGAPWPSCANPAGCPVFDTNTLAPFYARVAAQIRQVEPQKLIWDEPQVLFNFGADSSLPAGDPQGGFSFHVYCLAGLVGPAGTPCDQLEELVFQNADKQASETGQALLMSEFGATDDLATLRRNVRSADQHMISWQYWHYCECSDPTTSGSGTQAVVVDPSQPPTGSNVKAAKLELLSEPYPQVVAGTPKGYAYDEGARRFDLRYSTTAPNGANLSGFTQTPSTAKSKRKRKRKRGHRGHNRSHESKRRHKKRKRQGGSSQNQVSPASPQSEIFVGPRHYPNGYEVAIDGGGIASTRGAPLLRVVSCPGVREVALSVQPPGQGVTNGPDCVVAGTPLSRLRLKVRPKHARVGRRTCFRVTVRTESGTLLVGSQVRFNGARKKRLSNGGGRARICRRFHRPGHFRIKVTKLGFETAFARIRVRGP